MTDDKDIRISVVIPLYNKEAEIGAAVRSAAGQTRPPLEIIVIDDGSTDNGAEAVRAVGSPLVKFITQENAGVSLARNRGVAEAAGNYIAFLDGDDTWEPGYLEKIAGIITAYPGCGAYSAAFNIVRNGRKHPARTPEREGVVEDFFCTAMHRYIMYPSSAVVDKKVFMSLGGFPAGMKMGEDLHLWIRLASGYRVCFTPEPLVNYMVTAGNRSTSIYTPETTDFSFEELYRPEEGNSCRNEYIARCAIGKAVVLTSKGDTEYGLRTEKYFSYTEHFRRAWRRLRILNRLPRGIRPFANNAYNRLAWLIARKGF